MKRWLLCGSLLIIPLVAVLIWQLVFTGPKHGYDPGRFPRVIQEKDFVNSEWLEKLYGFIGRDFRDKDMSGLSREFMAFQTFDGHTKWPSPGKLPAGFDSQAWLEAGRNPGLSVRELHRQSITGHGIPVAVIDKYIEEEHLEMGNRLVYHPMETPQARFFQYRLHFHGQACASVLAGQTLGVAPGAQIHYFAVPDDGRNTANYCLALEELLKVNAGLAPGGKIRIVTISDGIDRQDAALFQRWQELSGKARQEGVAVVTSGSLYLNFTWGGCPPWLDRNDPENYTVSPWPRENDKEHSAKVLIPADYRTTAYPEDTASYAYWGEGGFSWAIPYVGGLAALAWSQNPALTFEEIVRLLQETATATRRGLRVVNPAGFLAAVRAGQSPPVGQ